VIADAIDGYLQAELLGGGMSRVYRAVRRRDGVVVAVKSVGLASDDVARAERRGAELQRQFHAVEPRVPDVLDIRAGAHELLIEMEYIDGEDLSTVLRSRGRFTPNEAVEVAAALADILDEAHRFVAVVDGETFNGIVHGDLKPRNIRVCATGGEPRHAEAGGGEGGGLADRVRVLDFGVAKGIRGGAGETRNVFGSAPYMSPERLMDGHVSTTSDCWSLGVVLCELLTGAAPYAGSERDVLRQIDAGPPQLPPDCPGDLVAIVHRLLARDLGTRLTSAGEAREALRRWRETTRRTSPISGAVAAAAAAAALGSEPNPTRRTEAGLGHAPTMPVSGVRHLPPIGGVPPLVDTGLAIPKIPPSGLPNGGETRRTLPTAAYDGNGHALEIPPIPAAVWQVPPIPTPSGPTSSSGPHAIAAAPADTGPQVATGPTGAIAPVYPRRKSRIGRLIGISFLIVLIVIAAQVAGEMRIWKESSLLSGKVHAAEPDALDEMVATYSSLAERSAFGFGTWPARQPLREALAHHVDRVLLDFRQPEPTVREMQWKQARAWAAKALELGADDSLRARYLLCDAHVKRIDGDAAIYRGQTDKGNRLLNEADSQFREASQLTRANPDAWLGLLRLHSGARSDPDQAQTDLNEAARRGWTAGARDYFLIGEATRNRAEAIEKSCDDQRTGERVKECLTQSRDLQKRAIEWYDKAVGLAAAAKGGVQAQRAVDRLDARLEGLDEFSMKGLGLDLLRLAVRSATKHNEKPPAAVAPPGASDGTSAPPQEDQRP
jgi:serine/threonine protein kinase